MEKVPAGTAIQAVLFDFGGVLAEEGFRAGLKAIAGHFRLAPDKFFAMAEEAVYGSGYVTGQGSELDFWKTVCQRAGIAADIAVLRQEILTRFVLRPRMVEAARRLRRQGLTTVILSDQTDWLDILEARDHFFQEFDHIFNSYYLGTSKRDPATFDQVVRQIGRAPGECLFVDDSPGHIGRAASRGLQALLFTGEAAFLAELRRLMPF